MIEEIIVLRISLQIPPVLLRKARHAQRGLQRHGVLHNGPARRVVDLRAVGADCRVRNAHLLNEVPHRMFAASGCRDDLDALLMRRAQSTQRALSDGAVVAQQRIIHIKSDEPDCHPFILRN